jgi:hypothetical protein
MFIFKAPFTAWEVINNTCLCTVFHSGYVCTLFVDTLGTSALLENIEKFRRDGCQVFFGKRLHLRIYSRFGVCKFLLFA